ncbi:hypothetical protein ABZ816_38305 [Actinosynnema sp. NPDC047251]|uniref:Uncharacterized protein n=1 Tax=Saccharothrix espanaensis (strain ATCC 51144 / DSM 44229 / JCM 9112 / NBRC 15066 / NRRL 15764) TaxID=1179773 RepID=K0JVX7_SACES|nr:hypothetical protein [Saccharothrix espanaensis]CCH30146.1 hypothetical protein BN6_28350 [Saccharothrix espanaensis DSM 44229]
MTTPQGDDPTVVDAEIVPDTTAPTTPTTPTFTPDYTDDGVPNFDYVRDRIEKRVHTAPAEVELAGLGGGGPTAESLDAQRAERDEAARAKLAEIRRSMGGG